ncbi:hypothetical protein [Staphylococcus canis]|uniref:hypothetical protein n=1 Tax=Staphylococcus canis TaxID=2724942 RepID=UPI001E6035F0|nr:hypothetical protein [Staphylococcus canis]
MENSLFWKKKFIPVYFIVAFLAFLLFKFYLKSNDMSIYLLILLIVSMGIASLVYNYKDKMK